MSGPSKPLIRQMNPQSVSDTDSMKAAASPSLRARLQRPRSLVLLAALLVAVWLIASWLIARSQVISTADARIAADMVAISADVSGNITATHVSVGDRVEVGDLLFEIDDREARHLLSEYMAAKEGLAAQMDRERKRLGLVGSKSGTQIDASRADVQSARATVAAAQSSLATAERDFERAKTLRESGNVTQDVLDQADDKLQSARQFLRAAEASLSASSAKAREAVISKDDASLVEQDLKILEAEVLSAQAKAERQKVIIEKHKIRSPINGVVDEMFFDAGERALTGFRVALLHDPENVWVSANIKETQVRHIAVGAPVRVKVDSAPGEDITGRIAVIRESTMAEAALMPNPNATGVFTKITQRIPVRIELDPSDVQLRPGSMVRVAIERRKSEK